uniref:Uncharacterized protein n=1 Tax=Romanomermis culicivorax TaxID=13658 RepID=A0A915K9V1_ROMCU
MPFFCLCNHANVEHSTKALGQKMHPAKLPSIKGSKQNTSSVTDDKKTEPYDNVALCAEMSSNLPVYLEAMLMNESPMETPTQAPTDTELDKETGMAIESLIKDIAEESFTIKTKIPSENDIIQIETDEEDVSQTDTTVPTTTAKTTSSLTPLSKSLSISQYKLDWGKGGESRAKAALMTTFSMENLSGIDDEDSTMIPPQIIPRRHKIVMSHETETSTPVSTDSRT